LKRRTDARQPTNTTERFKYDGLNRLTCAYFGFVENPNAPCVTSYGYAANGNLTYKSDVGMLSYTDPKHPHAVTGTPGETYSYNAVGNQIARPGGVSITYTAFDLPRTITQPGKSVSLGYDGDEQRIRKTTPTSETIYFEDLYERIENKLTGAFEHRYSVFSPERVIAVVTRGGNTPETVYLHVDHVGSTESVTDKKGSQVEKRSYDPFGQRRNVIWGLPPPASFATSNVKPGFTGHDEEDEFGLVHMKGRLFDPKLGRFTTTDPVITNVFNGQTLNGFSYVRNNPLTLVDPSGFTEEEAWRLWRAEETPGQLGLTITFDKLTPPTRPHAPSAAADVGANAPTNDVGTTGPGEPTEIPVVETEHPSGPGTDDPFGVHPPDIDLDRTPISTFDQLVTGSPTAGRRTLIIEDESGIGRDLRYAFGPPRELVVLRPRLGGEAGDDVSRAKQNLFGEGLLTAVTLLTPGPLDDMAATGLRGAVNLNSNKAIGRFGVYEIWVNKELYKIGKAHLDRITRKSTKPTRIHQQVEKLKRRYGEDVDHVISEDLGVTTTAEAKSAERVHLYRYYNVTGKVPPGNRKSFKP
jgi:RHS repeat-associated protein